MAKTIELHFLNSEGKVGKLSVDNPKEPIGSCSNETRDGHHYCGEYFCWIQYEFRQCEGSSSCRA